LDKPAWIDRILSDTQSHASFIEYIDSRESTLLEEMRDCIGKNKVEEARVLAGQSFELKELRNQLRMYEREEEQNAIIQEGRTRGY
jgi:hypothetical protein